MLYLLLQNKQFIYNVIKSVFPKINDTKSKYSIQMIDKSNINCWDVNVEFVYEVADDCSEGIKSLISGKKNNKRISVIRLEVLPENSSKSILIRKVLIEKKGCIKSTEEDQIIKWSIQEMFSSARFQNTRNFKLTKLKDYLSEEKNWILTDCSLINCDMWANGNYTLEKITAPINLTIYPKNIFNYM